MIALGTLYAVVALIIIVEVARVATRRRDVVRGVIDAAVWPLVLVLAYGHVLVDAVRARWRWTRAVARR